MKKWIYKGEEDGKYLGVKKKITQYGGKQEKVTGGKSNKKLLE